MPDQLTYSNLSSLYTTPTPASTERESMATALGAISNGAQSFMRENTLGSLAAAAQAVAASQADLDAQRRDRARADLFSATDAGSEDGSFDAELVVGSLLDDINAAVADIGAGKLEVTPDFVAVLAASFTDIVRFAAAIPQSLAEEVGETAAAVCTLIEEHDADASAIIRLFDVAE